MAPNTWSGLSADPYFNNWAPNQISITTTQSPNVGSGYSNTLATYQANGSAETSTNTAAAQTCISVPGANASGNDAFKVNSVYWSSTEYVTNTNKAYTRYLVQASSEGQDLKNNTLGSSTSGQYDNVRPIREF